MILKHLDHCARVIELQLCAPDKVWVREEQTCRP